MIIGLSKVHVLTHFDFNWLQLMLLYEVVGSHLVCIPLDLVVPDLHCVKGFLPDNVTFIITFIVNSDLHSNFHVVDAFVCVAVNHKAVDLDIILNGNKDNRLVLRSANRFFIDVRFRKSIPAADAIWSALTSKLIEEQDFAIFLKYRLYLLFFINNLAVNKY